MMKQYLYDMLHFSKGVRWFVLTESMLGIGIGLYSLLLNLHLLELGLTEGQMGGISSFGTIVMGATSIPCSILAGRFGRKRLLVLGLVLMATGYAIFAAGTELWMMAAAQLVQSTGISLLITTEIQLLYSYSHSKREETQGFSMLFAVYTLFTGVGTFAGGYLPGWLGGVTTDYQWTLVVAGGFILAAASTRYWLLPAETQDGRKRLPPTSDQVKPKRSWLRLPSRAVLILAVMNCLIGMAAAFTEPLLNVIIKFRLGWSDESISVLLTLNGLVLFISSFVVPPLLERIGFRWTYTLVFIGNLLTTFLLAAAMPAGMFSIVLLAKGSAFIMLNNLMLTHSMSVLPEEERNSYAGWRQVIRSAGSSLATFAAGLMLAGKQYGLPFLMAGMLITAGFLFYHRWVKPIFAAGLEEPETEKG